MNRHRFAALRLAALAPADRQWLLRLLPAQHRERITRELPAASRLHRAGPAQCAVWVRQIAGVGAVATHDVPQDVIDTIECASVETICQVTRGLPHRLLAELVGFRTWRWKLALLERLSETERLVIMDGPAKGRDLAPAARAALIELVAAQVRAHGAGGRPFDAWFADAAPAVAAG